MFYMWLEPEFHKSSKGTGSTLKSRVNGNHQNKWTSRICQGAASPSFGLLDRVSCWSPLELRPGDLHTPNSFLFSSRHYFSDVNPLGFVPDLSMRGME
jgi:hypothetical protein